MVIQNYEREMINANLWSLSPVKWMLSHVLQKMYVCVREERESKGKKETHVVLTFGYTVVTQAKVS